MPHERKEKGNEALGDRSEDAVVLGAERYSGLDEQATEHR